MTMVSQHKDVGRAGRRHGHPLPWRFGTPLQALSSRVRLSGGRPRGQQSMPTEAKHVVPKLTKGVLTTWPAQRRAPPPKSESKTSAAAPGKGIPRHTQPASRRSWAPSKEARRRITPRRSSKLQVSVSVSGYRPAPPRHVAPGSSPRPRDAGALLFPPTRRMLAAPTMQAETRRRGGAAAGFRDCRDQKRRFSFSAAARLY